jgi:hypothetical protein
MLDVPCVNLFDFFRRLGWEFALTKRGEEQTL